MFPRLLALAVPLVIATVPAQAVEVSGSLTTLAYSQQRFDVEGDADQLPLFEFLALDVRDLGPAPLSLHLDGFTKLDLREQTRGHDLQGELTYAYLQWHDRTTGVDLRAGRHFVRQGVASEYLDGASVDWLSGQGVGVELFAGQQVDGDFGGNTGDVEGGGRLYLRRGHYEVGLSGMEARDNDQPGFARYGLDGWGALGPVSASGHAFWDRLSEEVYDSELLLTWDATQKLLFTADVDRILPSLLLSHTSIFGNEIFTTGEQREIGLRADYRLTDHLQLAADTRQYDFSEGDDEWVAGGEARLRWGARMDREVGLRYEHEELAQSTHLFGRYNQELARTTHRFALARLYYALDFTLYDFDEPPFPANRRHFSHDTVATVGAELGEAWEASLSLDYGARADYRDFTTTTSGGETVRVPATVESEGLSSRDATNATFRLVYKFL
ncbi:MAG: hypothetical protein GW783_01345 [Deltaproteobacteria bacterium]|nr:hypothetical protein [Deltaproteobacteria bacterium]NCS72760.1 hypothetical protein [Deltaproteobacteria bacterium]PIU80034.1 MAG: hypothetical protein COS73_01530 [Nitrospirae bacterium CG06_land_8_20_14_3_00_70_43]PJB96997.1 MAG: hypothetical protein CO080_01515 [Nitrospirae bacterium CG_4_9_14_0_8_um_filter_70_14]